MWWIDILVCQKALSRENNAESIQNLELLKLSIKARIEDFDRFYNSNFHDDRIFFFEKLKFRLIKIIADSERTSKVSLELPLYFENEEKGKLLLQKEQERKQKLNKSTRSISKTPKKTKKTPTKSPIKYRDPKNDFIFNKQPQSSTKKPNVLFKVKMTKSEYEAYLKELNQFFVNDKKNFEKKFEKLSQLKTKSRLFVLSK